MRQLPVFWQCIYVLAIFLRFADAMFRKKNHSKMQRATRNDCGHLFSKRANFA